MRVDDATEIVTRGRAKRENVATHFFETVERIVFLVVAGAPPKTR
jgi:hypothetical protein